jgi:hypothetical protein
MGIFPPEDNLTDYTSDEQSDLGELSDYDVNSHSNHSTRSKGSLSGGSGREMDAAQRSWEKGVRGQKVRCGLIETSRTFLRPWTGELAPNNPVSAAASSVCLANTNARLSTLPA